MEPSWHDIPKRHQDRTWEIYGKSVPQLFLDRVAARPDSVAFRYKDLGLYQEVMALEAARTRSGVTKSMRNRIVRTGSKHLDQATLDARLKAAGWEGLKPKEVAFFYG